MRHVQRVTPELLPLPDRLTDAVLTGEEVMLRVGRSGFTLSYVPLAKAAWQNYPAAKAADPALLMNDEDAAVFAAFENAQLIGTACVRANSETNWGELLDIRVDAAFRRTGAASMLLDACDRFAVHRGMRGLRLEASEANPALCQFCEHTGFVLHGLDRMALVYSDSERVKPMARRACALFFYRLCINQNE